MSHSQTNFEAIKNTFYNSVLAQKETNAHLLLERCRNSGAPQFHERKAIFLADFNNWLNNLDIRTASQLITALKENGASLPKWATLGKYTIDYNNNGALDLIPSA